MDTEGKKYSKYYNNLKYSNDNISVSDANSASDKWVYTGCPRKNAI